MESTKENKTQINISVTHRAPSIFEIKKNIIVVYFNFSWILDLIYLCFISTIKDNLIVYVSDVYVPWKIKAVHLLNVESDALIISDSLANYDYDNYNLNKIYH